MDESSDSPEVQAFMAAFQKLRNRIDDNPGLLVTEAVKDESLANLCNDVFSVAFPLHEKERSRRELFSAPANPSFVKSWRDYESQYNEAVGIVSLWLACNVLPVEPAEIVERPLEDYWAAADAAASSDAAAVQQAIDYAKLEIEFYENEGAYEEDYVNEIKAGIAAWDGVIAKVGLDLHAVLRRRSLAPFVLVPRHVSNRYGTTDPLSLMSRLRQAQEAFIYGVPLAAFALMRSILELVLRHHYGGKEKKLVDLIENASKRGILPKAIRFSQIQRLLKLGNDALHENPELLRDVSNTEEEIFSLLMTLRILIESAPEATTLRQQD